MSKGGINMKYELLYIISQDANDEQKEALINKFSKMDSLFFINVQIIKFKSLSCSYIDTGSFLF